MGNYKFFVQQIDRQKRKAVIVGCIPFNALLKKVRYTFRDETSEGPYQRKIDCKRAKGIADYIKHTILNDNEGLPVFPTSIILAFNNDDLEDEEINTGELFEIDRLPDSILIVDGQHRFKAMQILNEESQKENYFLPSDKTAQRNQIREYLKSYRFNCCVLLNYDLWEQAQIFATVNFNQKKVNKSLFYDIYGIKAPEGDNETISKQNEIYLAHRLVRFLNESKTSPLKSMVKMLGEGKGYISQAFLVEQFLRLFNSGNIWGRIAEDYRKGGKKGMINVAAIELAAYFKAIKRVFPDYWPSENNAPASILYKTTGIGATVRFLSDLHNQMDDSLMNRLWEETQDKETYKDLIYFFMENLEYLTNDAAVLFGTGEDSLFKGTGGGGSQARLYNELKQRWFANIKDGI